MDIFSPTSHFLVDTVDLINVCICVCVYVCIQWRKQEEQVMC